MAKPIETRFCENCNEPVARGSRTCDNCGGRLKASRTRTGCVVFVVAVVVAIFAVISVGKYMSGDRFESPDQTGSKAAADNG